MNRIQKAAIALGFMFPLLPPLVAQTPDQFTESLEKGLKWRSIGPYRGGRVLAVAGVPGDPNTFYFGGVAGGVWRTTNAGLSWTPLFDKQAISSIGAIAVADSNPNVIYAGTGEAYIRGNISCGNGVYKKNLFRDLLAIDVVQEIETLVGRQVVADLDFEALEIAVRQQVLQLAGKAVEQRSRIKVSMPTSWPLSIFF